MSRSFAVRSGHDGAELDLTVDGVLVGTLPFRSAIDAAEFGADFVERDAERQRSREHHPAGKRLAE